MAKLQAALLGLSLGCSLFAQEAIVASKVNDKLAGITPDSKLWDGAASATNKAYLQKTIGFNDQKVPELNSGSVGKDVKVAALYNKTELALKITWGDTTKTVMDFESDSYGDGFALQLATNFKDPTKLPYIGMGNDGREVVVHLAKATNGVSAPNGNGDVATQVSTSNTPYFDKHLEEFEKKVAATLKPYAKSFVAKGFRSTTEIEDSPFSSSMSFDEKSGTWSATIVRSLKDSYIDLSKAQALPVALAFWDGDKANRDGLKNITTWLPVKLSEGKDGAALVGELLSKAEGDLESGKKVAMDNCAACHRFPGADSAPEYMAPNLTNIGGYSTKGYLIESIKNPSAVVVPGYNTRAHSSFAWYNVDEKGVRNSTMPAYDWLDEKSLNDLVAFLQTLKEEK